MAIDWAAEVTRLEALVSSADPTVSAVEFPDGRKFQFSADGGRAALAHAKAQAAAASAGSTQPVTRTFARPRAETW